MHNTTELQLFNARYRYNHASWRRAKHFTAKGKEESTPIYPKIFRSQDCLALLSTCSAIDLGCQVLASKNSGPHYVRVQGLATTMFLKRDDLLFMEALECCLVHRFSEAASCQLPSPHLNTAVLPGS